MIKEFIHVFKGFGRVDSQCLVRMYSDDGETMICFIDLGVGTSVTNSSEQLAAEIVTEYKLLPNDCRFFETYQQYDYECFDEIEYEWTEGKTPDGFLISWKAKNPKWKPCNDETIKNFFIKVNNG